MFLLVTRNTKLIMSNGPRHTLRKGVGLHVASDSAPDEYVVRVIDRLENEPPRFCIADGFDYAFPRRMYANILEYTTWDSFCAAARMCH